MTKEIIKYWIIDFIKESNAIEGINRPPTKEEIDEAFRFLEIPLINLHELKRFVSIYQPNAELRDQPGLNVRIGAHYPPAGGPKIVHKVEELLKMINDDASCPFLCHQEYETLHPFTDCNGRSGRIIWLWQMLKLKRKLAPMGFLQTYYYQSLNNYRK